LTENWRNTKNIFKAVNNYYQGEIRTRPVGPSGEIINPILLKKNENKIKKVDELIKYYLYEEGLRAEQIAILTGSKYGLGSSEYCIHGSAFSKEIFPEKCVLAESSNSNEIVFDSIKRFKGLERDVIILVELENLIEQQKFQELYIGLSRARMLLDIVIENEKIFESIIKNIL
jgi:DNA helicase IV